MPLQLDLHNHMGDLDFLPIHCKTTKCFLNRCIFGGHHCYAIICEHNKIHANNIPSNIVCRGVVRSACTAAFSQHTNDPLSSPLFCFFFATSITEPTICYNNKTPVQMLCNNFKSTHTLFRDAIGAR